MKKVIRQKPQDEQSIDILKRVVKRVEEATVDIHSIKYDIKAMKLDMGFMQSDFAIMKVDVEKTREELRGVEDRLGKRISNVADLITISLSKKLQKVGKRVAKVEKIQQSI